jgi:uncharacterized membrane protein
MFFHFSHPQYLFLLPLVWGFTWWVQRRSLADLGRGRGRVSGWLRGVLLTLLVFALSGLHLVRPTTTQCTVFVVDVSDSTASQQHQALTYIRKAIAHKRPGDQAALVAFGAEALLNYAPDDPEAHIEKIYALPNTSRTNIAAGIQVAMASFPQDAGKHVVLFTDGNENLGDAVDQANLAFTRDVRISVVPLQRDLSKGEALLRQATSPMRVKEGATFEVVVVAESLRATDGTITLFRNTTPVERRAVRLRPGTTVVTFEELPDTGGLYRYRAVLDTSPTNDTVPDNNTVETFTRVEGAPHVLVVEGYPGAGRHLATALRAHALRTELRGVDGVPASLAECARYDSLIFADVPSWVMSPAQMSMIRSAVHDAGLGFAMLGGENSFGAGGYADTPLEQALPVSMKPRAQAHLPTMTLVIVIDISGSMSTDEDGVPKIKVAAQAACAAVELLKPIDNVCVIGFDTNALYVVPMTKADQKPRIVRQIQRLEPGGGGIMTRAALQEAYQAIRGMNTQIKHVILCADAADTEEHEGCLGVIRQMRQEQITLSVVGFGHRRDPDVPFHREMAQAGGGLVYLAERMNQLPRFFSRDVMLMSKSLLNEQPFLVHLANSTHPVTRQFRAVTAPPLLGYVTTSKKETPTALQLLIAPQGDPVLAVWNYGLGRTLAFTSDATTHWGMLWLDWDHYAVFWAQAVRWLHRQRPPQHFQTTVAESQGQITVTVDAITAEGEFRNLLDLSAHIVYMEKRAGSLHEAVSETISLPQTGPGQYEAVFPARQPGTYLITVEERDGPVSTGRETVSLSIPYSPEYRMLQANTSLMVEIAERARGAFAPPPEAVYTRLRIGARVMRALGPTLLLLLALLFLFDIAVRRLLMPWSELFARAGNAVLRHLPAWHRTTPARRQASSATMESLLGVKSKVRHTAIDAPPSEATLRPRASVHTTPDDPAPAPPSAAEPRPPTSLPASVTGELLSKKRERRGK